MLSPNDPQGMSTGAGGRTAVALLALPFATGLFFCLRSTSTLVTVRLFGGEPRLGAAVSLGVEFGLLALVAVDRVSSGRRGEAAAGSVRYWVLAYLLFSGMSLFWTEAASVPASFAYWSGTACDALIVILLIGAGDRQQVTLSILTGFAFGACAIAIASWLMPAQYDLRLGDEDYLNANTIANICALGFFFALCLRRSGRGTWTITLGFLAITLLRSISKSGIAAFAVSSLLLLIHDRSTGRRVKFALTSAAVVAVLLFWGLFEAYYDVYTTTGNQALTLTGRTAIWAYVADSIPNHPWIGHGFDSIWGTVPAFGTFEARHAENEALQQLYAYGAAGLLLLVGVYTSFYVCARRLGRQPVGLILRCILLYVVVRGLAEAEPFDLLLPIWAIVLLGSFASGLAGASEKKLKSSIQRMLAAASSAKSSF